MKWFDNKSLPRSEILPRTKVHSGNRNISCIRYPTLIQHRRSGWKERFLYCSHTWKLTLCFPQERLQKLEGGKVIQCWNLNRIVLFRQHWISQIRSTDKCDAWNKGQKRDTLKIGAKFSREGNDNKCSEREHLVCICIIQLQ